MREGPNYYHPTPLLLSIPGVAGSIVRFHSIISKKRTREPCRETLWWRVPIIIIIIPPHFPYPYLVLQDPLSGFIQLSARKEPGNHVERHYEGGSQLLSSHPSSPIHTWCCRIHCRVSFNYQQEKNQETMQRDMMEGSKSDTRWCVYCWEKWKE